MHSLLGVQVLFYFYSKLRKAEMVYLGTPKGGMTTDTGCLILYLEIRGKRTTVRVGGLRI